MKKSVSTGEYKLAVLFVFFLLIFWQWAVWFFHFPSYILPAPSEIVQALAQSFGVLIAHAKVTVLEAAFGFGGAVLLAVFLALLMDSIPWVKKALYPLLVTSQTIPIISVAPLFLIWFGYGMMPKVIVVTLVCFFPIVISLLDGLAAVDEELINLLRTMGAGKKYIFINVKLPGAMPAFFSGLKIAAAYSIMGAVIGEWLGASKGIGVFMTRSQHSFLLDRVFAGIVVITVLSLGIFAVIKFMERLLMPWLFVNEGENNK
ncbi:MAG: ABC transporter permease [Bacillota bacterium]|jgi:ABC-type nitrate/sulfonate/bicarbonate transport system permease component